LYMSGYPDMTTPDQGTVPTYFVFLEKPFTAAKLAAKVREALSLES
jgi:DNA-binding NtrC family response regulator